jgi:hypothetical protein
MAASRRSWNCSRQDLDPGREGTAGIGRLGFDVLRNGSRLANRPPAHHAARCGAAWCQPRRRRRRSRPSRAPASVRPGAASDEECPGAEPPAEVDTQGTRLSAQEAGGDLARHPRCPAPGLAAGRPRVAGQHTPCPRRGGGGVPGGGPRASALPHDLCPVASRHALRRGHPRARDPSLASADVTISAATRSWIDRGHSKTSRVIVLWPGFTSKLASTFRSPFLATAL